MKKLILALSLVLPLWIACQTQMVASSHPQWFLNKSRQPASALPVDYKVKNQDHWLLGVWESDENSPFLAVCKIRKTPIGFEAGSSKDVSGAAIMQVVQDQRDQKWLDLLTSATHQGFDDGYSPYWSDCHGKDAKAKCKGRLSLLTFMSYDGVGQMNGASTDLFEERNAAVMKGTREWHSSANSADILKSVQCLCAKYARPEEKEFFPGSGCTADGVALNR